MKWFWRIAGALVLIASPGVIYEQWSQRKDFEKYSPPGQLYDVGDHRLHLHCAGSGSPTVILEASGLGNTLSYAGVMPLLAKRTRTCAYDRAGMGFSQPSGRALTSKVLAEELEALVKAAKLEPPFVLAGASIGGLTVEMFARRNPEQVAGLVFLDAVDSQSLEVVGSELAALRLRACAGGWLGRVGLLRLLDPLKLTGLEAALTYRSAPFDAACSVLGHLAESDREHAAAPALKADVPLLVLSHEVPVDLLPPGDTARAKAFEPAWQRLQQAQAKRSTRGTQSMVAASGHLVAQDRPEAVAQAILELLDRAAAPGP